jgi:hypothetical protein
VHKKQAIDLVCKLKISLKTENGFAYALNNGYNERPFDIRGVNNLY